MDKQLSIKDTKAQLLEGYEQSLEELNLLKQKLEATDSELISFEKYYQDFQNRFQIHSREWNCLFNEDLPSYLSASNDWLRTNLQLLRELPVLQKLSF